jgi:hypothetical protein
LLRPDSKGDPKTIALLLLHAVALTLTTSTLGLMLLLIGTMTLLLVTRRLDVLAAIALVGGVAFVAISAWFGDSPFAMWAQYTGERVAVRQEVIGSSGFEDSLVQSLEIFDASALNFLFHRPEHFVFGAGPGMVSLPASDYIPPGGAQLIFGDRIDSIPFMGVLRAISDSGFVGLGLWLLNVLALIHALRRCEMAFPKDRSWTNSRVYFLVFAVLYLVQTRPAWYVWLGVGLAAALQERELELLELAKAKERRRKLTTRSIPARAPAVEHS